MSEVRPKVSRNARGQSGFTLLEALITGAISSIVIGGILVLVSFVGNRLEATGIEQQLSQESAFISEFICRKVREGANVAVSGGNSIMVTGPTENGAIVFSTGANPISFAGANVNLPYRSRIQGFTLLQLPTGVRVSFSLAKSVGSNMYTTPLVTVNCLCKSATSN